MVILTPKFTSLLAFVISSSMLMGVDALPYRPGEDSVEGPVLGRHFPLPAVIPRRESPNADIELRDHRHHHHSGHRTKVYADDPVIVSGNGNHVHAHSHKRHRRHRGHHGHHGHHGSTKVYADDPLIVSGDNNHVHAHSHKRSDLRLNLDLGPQLMSLGARKNHHHHHHHHDRQNLGKRGLLDPLVPLAGSLPGVAGVIGLVNMLSHTVLSDTLADLIISPAVSSMSAQSVDGEQAPSYVINASNTSSTTMYLVAQNATANVGPSEQVVLVTMPMLNPTDQSIKMYCATYDPNSTGASQLSSQPCSYNTNAGLDINSTSTRFSQLFSWNIETGEISPLWQRTSKIESMTDTVDVAEPPSSADGYVVGGPAPTSFSAQQSQSSGKLAMVFKLASSAYNATVAPAAPGVDPNSVMNWSDNCDEADGSPAEDDQPQTDASSGDYECAPSTSSDDPDDGTVPEDVKDDEDTVPSSTSDTMSAGQGPSPTNLDAAQEATVVTSTFTMLIAPTASATDGSLASGIFSSSVLA